MEPIISIAAIQAEAVDAADADKSIAAACRWPASSVAAEAFRVAYELRAEQLQSMAEVQ